MRVVGVSPRIWELASKTPEHLTIARLPAHNFALALERRSCTKLFAYSWYQTIQKIMYKIRMARYWE